MTTVTERAPCKANLYLDVVGLRADGYHGIESVMATLPLSDAVSVTRTESDVSVAMTSGGALTPELNSLPVEKNLAYRAAKLFFESSGIDGGADIKIEKNIPSRFGLGGGSADAAATLRALDRLYDTGYGDEELCRLALALGADVPFCVARGVALCRGVGEIMTPIENKIGLHGVITAERAEKKSTAEAYRLVDAAKCCSSPEYSAADMATALEAGNFDAVCRSAYNVFGEACGYPDDVRRRLRALGAPFVLMSGAGPSVVALTESAAAARNIAEIIMKDGCFAYSF